MPSATVLDSHALLAFLLGEQGGVVVKSLLESAGKKRHVLHMTELNYAEVKYIILRRRGLSAWSETAGGLPEMPIEFHPIDRALADIAADYKSRHPMSLADACTAALAKQKKAELVTGDPEFKPLNDIKVVWLARGAPRKN